MGFLGCAVEVGGKRGGMVDWGGVRGGKGPRAWDFCMMPVEGVLVEGEGALQGVEGGRVS